MKRSKVGIKKSLWKAHWNGYSSNTCYMKECLRLCVWFGFSIEFTCKMGMTWIEMKEQTCLMNITTSFFPKLFRIFYQHFFSNDFWYVQFKKRQQIKSNGCKTISSKFHFINSKGHKNLNRLIIFIDRTKCKERFPREK